MKKIVVLGCTGSIGSQTLDVISMFPDLFTLTGISARGSSPQKLIGIIERFKPQVVVVESETAGTLISDTVSACEGRLFTGAEAIEKLAAGHLAPVDLVVSAQSGTSGVRPTISALEAGVDVALANKETLVTGGEWVVSVCHKSGSRLFPVDSEHSAIARCIAGMDRSEIKNLVLTCSGGPFFFRPEIDLEKVTPADALAHPTWSMGRKITIDSATLMNKGLEIIEARWLFDIPQERINIVIHPQSIIHSMVETCDGSMMAQLSVPDMRYPILHALTGGRHVGAPLPVLDLARLGSLTFAAADTGRFPCLGLARQALTAGGTMTAVLNTANEIAVDAFCRNRIGFMDIPRVIESAMAAHQPVAVTGLDVIAEVEIRTARMISTRWPI